MNSISMDGHLGRDAEIRHTPSGHQIAEFSMASKGFAAKDATIWIDVETWGKAAEWVGKYQKGEHVLVYGTLKDASYEKQDGTKVKKMIINANRVVKLTPKKARPQPEVDTQAPNDYSEDTSSPREVEDDIPF